MPTYWLSFAPESGPARVYLLDGADEVVARVKAHAQKLYRPGDELLIFEIPADARELDGVPRGRELTEAELALVDAQKLGDIDPELS